MGSFALASLPLTSAAQEGWSRTKFPGGKQMNAGIEQAKGDLKRSWHEIHNLVKTAGKPLGLSPEQMLQITRTIAREAELTAIGEFEKTAA